ncbi:MAG: hypothetical protein E6Q42_08900 [Dechloromonas sp.]|nr:MAG: hypothetical protein E6Q42_08900 [Dechloromonas sp.]
MKRRDFLASVTALSLFASEAWATKKQTKPATAKPGTAKAKPRAGAAKPAPRHKGKTKATPAPQQAVAHTADDPVFERPPQGTSASRLPPVKAPEPPNEWRTYEITTTINLKGRGGPAKLWLPLPLNQDTLYQRTLGHSWIGNPASAGMRRLPGRRPRGLLLRMAGQCRRQAATDHAGHHGRPPFRHHQTHRRPGT